MNKAIIAEFMGRKFYAYKGNSSYNEEFATYKECEEWIRDFLHDNSYAPEIGWKLGCGKYHSSWEWLMPVVEKIEQLGYDTNIISYLGDNITVISEGTPQGDGGKYTENIADETAETKIQATWQAVIQFIEWYNKEQSVQESDTTKV